jgi:ubiquinol-cytochrome c reductase cytochrome c1 subunit
VAVLVLVPALVVASEAGHPLDRAPDRSSDLTALQNGARLFVNYCLNCHSASLVRYNQLRNIGLSEAQIRDNLLFTSDKVGDLMKSNLSVTDAKAWFGAAPPDLSLIFRAKSS